MAVDIFDGSGNPIFPDVAVNTDGSNNNMTDPTSGQPNVSTPASPIPANGWPGNGIPIFSDFNKLFRLITQWIRWTYDIITRDVLLTGACPNSTNLGISLPSGFTNDNTIILGGCLHATGVDQSQFPLFMYRINGTDTSYISVWMDHAPDQILISWFEGSALKNLNGLSYKVLIRKTA